MTSKRELALEDLALTDALTRTGNRRYFDQVLASEISLAREMNRPLTLGVVVLDRFKAVNDTRGHQAGDLALMEFSAVPAKAGA